MLRLNDYLIAFINNETEYLIDTFARFCTYEKEIEKIIMKWNKLFLKT